MPLIRAPVCSDLQTVSTITTSKTSLRPRRSWYSSSDWSEEEYQELNGFKLDQDQEWAKRSKVDAQFEAKLSKLLEGPVPAEVDWRKVPNRVSEVKDQGHCGSCWAFSTTGVLEGQEAVHNFSKLITLSEQELVDCSQTNSGCKGGMMWFALTEIAMVWKGIESEQDYPYKAVDQKCRMDKSKAVLNIKGAHTLEAGDEDALLKAVAKYGPVSVAIEANKNLMHYKSGVFSDPECNAAGINHAVLVVGYGHDAKEGDYWIVKNSWGAKWGEKGYIRMRRGHDMCGIASYPTLADF